MDPHFFKRDEIARKAFSFLLLVDHEELLTRCVAILFSSQRLVRLLPTALLTVLARAKPMPAPAPAAPTLLHTLRSWGLKQWTWVGVAVLVAGGLSQVPTPSADRQPIDPALGPSVVPGQVNLTPPVEMFDGGIDSPVQWRDHILTYSGKLLWDGRSTLGKLSFTAKDQGNGQTVAQGEYRVTLLPVNPQRIRFNMRLALAGDSHTPRAHSHDINLIYDRQPNGRWRFVQNCPGANTCY